MMVTNKKKLSSFLIGLLVLFIIPTYATFKGNELYDIKVIFNINNKSSMNNPLYSLEYIPSGKTKKQSTNDPFRGNKKISRTWKFDDTRTTRTLTFIVYKDRRDPLKKSCAIDFSYNMDGLKPNINITPHHFTICKIQYTYSAPKCQRLYYESEGRSEHKIFCNFTVNVTVKDN